MGDPSTIRPTCSNFLGPTIIPETRTSANIYPGTTDALIISQGCLLSFGWHLDNLCIPKYKTKTYSGLELDQE